LRTRESASPRRVRSFRSIPLTVRRSRGSSRPTGSQAVSTPAISMHAALKPQPSPVVLRLPQWKRHPDRGQRSALRHVTAAACPSTPCCKSPRVRQRAFPESVKIGAARPAELRCVLHDELDERPVLSPAQCPHGQSRSRRLA
jgi:hypothetical protein